MRTDSRVASMSDYLITAMDEAPNVTTRYRTEVVGAEGDDRLEQVVVEDASGDARGVRADMLLVLIGSRPNTAWLEGSVALDDWGFVLTVPRARRAALAVTLVRDSTGRIVRSRVSPVSMRLAMSVEVR